MCDALDLSDRRAVCPIFSRRFAPPATAHEAVAQPVCQRRAEIAHLWRTKKDGHRFEGSAVFAAHDTHEDEYAADEYAVSGLQDKVEEVALAMGVNNDILDAGECMTRRPDRLPYLGGRPVTNALPR